MAKAEIIPSQLQICVERITKEIAKEYLSTSYGNRTYSNNDKNRMMREFNPKNWIADSGQGVTFDINKKLIDGHTRLFTFLESNLDYIDITVVRGVNINARLIYDTGKKRTHQATLAMRGVKHFGVIATILGLYSMYVEDLIGAANTPYHAVIKTKGSISNATISTLYDAEKNFIDTYAKQITFVRASKNQIACVSPRIANFIGYVLYRNGSSIESVIKLLKCFYYGLGCNEKLSMYRNELITFDKFIKTNDTHKIDMFMRFLYSYIGKDVKLKLPKSDNELINIQELKTIIL